LNNATAPATTSPNDRSVVPTGRRTKGVERFMATVFEIGTRFRKRTIGRREVWYVQDLPAGGSGL
jgi:hypothetical protein